MGAYGSPELPPIRPPYPLHEQVTSHTEHGMWTGPRRHSVPVRLMLWSAAVVVVSLAAMVVVAIIAGTISALHH